MALQFEIPAGTTGRVFAGLVAVLVIGLVGAGSLAVVRDPRRWQRPSGWSRRASGWARLVGAIVLSVWTVSLVLLPVTVPLLYPFLVAVAVFAGALLAVIRYDRAHAVPPPAPDSTWRAPAPSGPTPPVTGDGRSERPEDVFLRRPSPAPKPDD